MATVSGVLSSIAKGNLLAVAGGGGGAGIGVSLAGAGGGANGGNVTAIDVNKYGGVGGSQSVGGFARGSYGKGADCDLSYAGGGGGGLYGGGRSTQDAGGAGGSGYIMSAGTVYKNKTYTNSTIQGGGSGSASNGSASVTRIA